MHYYSELPDRPMKTCVARWAFWPVLFFVSFLCVERAFSGELQRIGIVSVFDPELMAGGQRGPNWEETYTWLASKNAASVAAATLDTINGR
jgi:hypothetical protein